ncbi:TFPI1 inhibitor, partial [Buphagus erythrorhynchus]|nr:TFPI1 inhibitor [Buphagus erythrorhynchus]
PPLKLVHSFCAMKADDGPCKAIHIRYFFNIRSRRCEVFEYGGCHGNENNFLTLEECQQKCVATGQYLFSYPPTNSSFASPDFCFHAQEPGVCRGYFTRLMYNCFLSAAHLLPTFSTTGCLQLCCNPNNFLKILLCFSTEPLLCGFVSSRVPPDWLHRCLTLFFLNPLFSGPPPIPSLCMTPMDRGLCRAKELRFFYNHSTGRCRPFSYSGCGGNENNFISRKSCLRICKK